ncbi:MAG: sensor histidine kinase [Rhizobiaceae bacterium]
MAIDELKVYRVTDQTTVSDRLKTALIGFCSSWACDSARTENARAQDVRLTGFLLAIPFASLLNMATAPASLSTSAAAVSMAALSVAVPLVLTACLAKFNNDAMRRFISVALAPLALISMTQGHLNVVAVTVLILAILTFEAANKRFAKTHLGIGSVVALSLASVLLALSDTAATQIAALFSFGPAALAGLAYMVSGNETKIPTKDVTGPSAFEIATQVSAGTGVVLVHLDRTAQVTEFSPNAYDVFQLDKNDFAGSGFLDRVHIADKVVLLSQLDAVANGQASERFTIRLQSLSQTPGKSKVWIDLACSAIALGDQLVLKVEALAQPAANVAEQSNGAALSALTIVSHELRTPLNAIIGFTDLMGKGLAGEIANERQREYLDIINKSGVHLLELVNGILDLSKLGNGTYELEPEEFLPDETTAFAISMLATQAREKQLGLDYFPLCGLEGFSGDKRVSQQIIINLLSNAVKFTPNHGHISLRVHLDDHRLVIEVEDTGRGMSKDELSKVGTPFFQASGSHGRLHEGAGLGLSLVRQMAVLHGGAMEIHSEPGKGTKVRVALASLRAKENVVSYLNQKDADESVRTIQLNEDSNHGPSRKTA